MGCNDQDWAVFWCSLLSPVLLGEIPEAQRERYFQKLSREQHWLPTGLRRSISARHFPSPVASVQGERCAGVAPAAPVRSRESEEETRRLIGSGRRAEDRAAQTLGPSHQSDPQTRVRSWRTTKHPLSASATGRGHPAQTGCLHTKSTLPLDTGSSQWRSGSAISSTDRW